MAAPRFLISEDDARLVDISRQAFPDAPAEATGPTVLLCPHCGHDERGGSGPHEMFDLLDEAGRPGAAIVSGSHFRCRSCGEVSPAWVIRGDGGVTTHLREAETGEPCMPPGFHAA